jgi:plastocyanin
MQRPARNGASRQASLGSPWRRVTGRVLGFAVLSVAVLMVAAAPGGPGAARAAQPLGVRAGAGEAGYAVNTFLPANLTVPAGGSVRWDFPWFEPHSVTFGTPSTGAPQSTPSPATYEGTGFLTSDLIFGPGKSYEVTFPRPGTYAYSCYFHANMRGAVTVVTVGTAADSQSAADARGAAEYNAAVAELKGMAAALGNRTPAPAAREGQVIVPVVVALETRSGDVQQYFPAAISVHANEAIEWKSLVHTPHTVTFGPFPGGAILAGNPAVDNPSVPAAAYDGTGFWNSGVIGVDRPAGLTFTMTFSKPGVYRYYCIMHESQGMVGTVTVLPAAPAIAPTVAPPAPAPPETGRIARDGRFAEVLVLTAGMSLLAAGLSGLGLARRRR